MRFFSISETINTYPFSYNINTYFHSMSSCNEFTHLASGIIRLAKNRSIVENSRLFRESFGLSSGVAEILWKRLKAQQMAWSTSFKQMHLLMAFFFLKTYTTERLATSVFKVTPKTFRKWVRFVIIGISKLPLVRRKSVHS